MSCVTFCRNILLLIIGIVSLSCLGTFSGLLITKTYILPETCLLIDKSNTAYNCRDSLYIEKYQTYYDCGNTVNYIIKYTVLVGNIEYVISGAEIPHCTTVCKLNSYESKNEKAIYDKGIYYSLIQQDLRSYNKMIFNNTFECYISGDKNRVYLDDYIDTYTWLLIADIISLSILIFCFLSFMYIYFPWKCRCVKHQIGVETEMGYVAG